MRHHRERARLDHLFATSEHRHVGIAHDRPALKTLRQIQPKIAHAIRAGLAAIATASFESHANVQRMTGIKDGFRLRHGSWRGLYILDREADTMWINWVKPRGSAYR